MEQNIEVENSSLSQELSVGDKTIDVQIYRERGGDWVLEVIDEFHNSRIWNELFSSDAEALNEVEARIKEKGIDSLIG